MEKEPRKFCKPGDTPDTSLEPCVPVGINSTPLTVTWGSVSMVGEDSLEGEELFEETIQIDVKAPSKKRNN